MLRIVVRLLCYLCTSLHEQCNTLHIAYDFIKTILLEWIYDHYALLEYDCCIRVYWLFATIFYKYINIAINNIS